MPQPTHPAPGQRMKTDGVTTKPGPGRTTNITTKSDGKTSFKKVPRRAPKTANLT